MQGLDEWGGLGVNLGWQFGMQKCKLLVPLMQIPFSYQQFEILLDIGDSLPI